MLVGGTIPTLVLLAAACASSTRSDTPFGTRTPNSTSPRVDGSGASVALCRVSQLRLSATQGAAGGLSVHARNAGRPCALGGPPAAVGFDKRGRRITTMRGD